MTGAPATPAIARPRLGRPRVVLTALGVIGLLGAVAILPALPWLMGIVTDARHSYTADVPAENRGAYLVTSDGAMQLFAWYVDLDAFPSDAPTLQQGAVSAFAVVQKQHAAVDDYRLLRLSNGQRIPWADSSEDGMKLVLVPSVALQPDEYELIAPTDSMFGGVTRHFFRIAAPQAAGKETQ
jgi:hypothetical protein